MVSILSTVELPLLLPVAWPLVLPTTGWPFVSALVLIVAVLVRLVARGLPARPQRVLMLGSGPMAAKLAAEIESVGHSRCSVVGIVSDEEPEPQLCASVPWLGPCERLDDIVREVAPTCIVVAATDRRDRLPMQALLEWRVRGIPVEDAPEFYERLTGKVAIETVRPGVLIMAKGFRNHGATERLARFSSMVIAAAVMLLAAPLFAAICLAIKLDSRGPVFFVQPRAGRDGRTFGLIKFRTMHPCAEARSEWVADNADRITRLGRWLRRFRLDELPQLANVLRGEMNLVGPRPHPASNHVIFIERIAYYAIRSSVRPGMTGWAQVRYGYANNLDEETEKMRYDLFYIKNRSLWLDVRILLETVVVCLLGSGASTVRRAAPGREALAAGVPVATRT
jgi:exopolysaccharide biosynthesis polyprenyl glycosylphosphotransferase